MTYHARVGANGDVVLPAHIVEALGLNPGDHIEIARADSGLIIRTDADVIAAGQRAFAATILRPFTVDEFIADRRAEAARG